MALAIVLVWASGRWRPLARQLLQPGDVFIGLTAGVPLFLLSLIVVQGLTRGVRAFRSTLTIRSASGSLSFLRAGELGLRATWEEVLWRGTFQVLLGSGVFAVTLTASLFAARHLHLEVLNRRMPSARKGLELFLFAVILGLVYAQTDRVLLVVGLHWMRNLLLEGTRPAFPLTGVAPSGGERIDGRA